MVVVVVTEGAAEGVVVEVVVEAVVAAVAEDSRCKGHDKAAIERKHNTSIEQSKRGGRRALRQNETYASGSAHRLRHPQKRRPRFISNVYHVRHPQQARRSAFLGLCIGKVQERTTKP